MTNTSIKSNHENRIYVTLKNLHPTKLSTDSNVSVLHAGIVKQFTNFFARNEIESRILGLNGIKMFGGWL